MRKPLIVAMVCTMSFLVAAGLAGEILDRKLVRVLGDAMDRQSKQLAGERGINCGRVRLGGDPKVATACAIQAQADGKPFRVRYDIMGFDADVAGAIVRTTDGRLYGLSFDGNPSGAGGTSFFRERVALSPCPQPTHLWVNPKGRVNCFQQGLVEPTDIMAPNFESY
jgi:hypothetical protein